MINQSFKVLDICIGVSSKFLIDENSKWITEIGGNDSCVLQTLEISQDDANIAYDYFSSHWQDYDVTLLEPAQNTSSSS
jgi:hypothetical protein